MKQVKKMPTEGQFVAVWANADGTWSGTYKWVGRAFSKYNDYYDEWRESIEFNSLDAFNAIYYIAE